ncbi:hypothetical protein PYW07_007643 [Mythimna separata]|uniref:Uncharacterized protein n=1 Tax=Mythimna separata TaxID=271217 RepID=A0AAD8DV34_MYTSE|nr:hypothetical protein PYW07_007643 [Mythimna separata]
MISTPWSTESGFSINKKLTRSLSTWAMNDSLDNWSSVDPMSTTASAGSLSSAVYSADTITLLTAAPSHSKQMCLPLIEPPSLRAVDSWAMYMAPSEDQLSLKSRVFSVGYPWGASPASSATDFYPSSTVTFTLKSRKGSRVSVSHSLSSSQKRHFHFPMNYINSITLQHPGLEWAFTKQHGFPVITSIPL